MDERQSDNSSAGLDRHESDGGGKTTTFRCGLRLPSRAEKLIEELDMSWMPKVYEPPLCTNRETSIADHRIARTEPERTYVLFMAGRVR